MLKNLNARPKHWTLAMLSVSVLSPTLHAAISNPSPLSSLPQASSQAGTAQNPDAEVFSTHRFHQDHVLGTSLDVVLVGLNDAEADVVMAAMLAEIERLDRVLSVWREDSEISQLNQSRVFSASEDLFAVIAACEYWQGQTCSAFSARLGGLLQQWQSAQHITDLHPVVSDAQRDWGAVAAQLQQAKVSLDEKKLQIQRDESVQFAPDGLAKGYVIDRVIAVALSAQPKPAGVLVDIGGDLRVWGTAPRAGGWRIGVRPAGARTEQAIDQVLRLQNQAVALSGRGARDWLHQATQTSHSHLFSPRTGLPLDAVEQVVVVAEKTADADALATALAAMDEAEGLALVESLVGFEAQVSLADGQSWQSSGWQNLLAHTQNAQMQQVSAGGSASVSSSGWPSGFKAVLDVEIPKISASNYRAPYVVVWITDAQKQLVRSLNIWGDDRKWMDTNYVWWRRYGRKLDVDSTAQPSRKPGQYRVIWDGKNDAGETMPAGEYTIHIEAAREHGEHTYQSFPLKVEPKSSVQQRAAQQELGQLTLRFDRVI